MSKSIFESLHFLFGLEVFKLKMFFLRKNIFCFGLAGDQRFLKRAALIRNQEQALLEYGRRAMFGDELFDAVKKAGHKSPVEHNAIYPATACAKTRQFQLKKSAFVVVSYEQFAPLKIATNPAMYRLKLIDQHG